jgi:hypothetical protein
MQMSKPTEHTAGGPDDVNGPEQTLKRLSNHLGVLNYVVLSKTGKCDQIGFSLIIVKQHINPCAFSISLLFTNTGHFFLLLTFLFPLFVCFLL